MAYWCDDYGLYLQQKRLDDMQARMKRRAEKEREKLPKPPVV